MKGMLIVTEGRGKESVEIGEVFQDEFDQWNFVHYDSDASGEGLETREQAIKAVQDAHAATKETA